MGLRGWIELNVKPKRAVICWFRIWPEHGFENTLFTFFSSCDIMFLSVRTFSLLTATCSHYDLSLPFPCLCFPKIVKFGFTSSHFPHFKKMLMVLWKTPESNMKRVSVFAHKNTLTLHDLTKSWNIFKWPLITQLEAEWLPVMCWPFRVQSIHRCLSSKRSNCHSWPFLYGECEPGPFSITPSIKTSQYAQQLHSGEKRMHGMCLQHHNSSPFTHGLIWPGQKGIGQ